MASGISNACRMAGLAMGVAALGAIFKGRISTSLADTLGPHSACPRRGGRGDRDPSRRRSPEPRPPATVAFVSGLNTTLLVGSVVVAIGALAAGR